MTPRDLIEKVGGSSRLAKALGYRTHSAVLKWSTIPAERLLDIEREFKIPREDLRPDLYERTPAASTPEAANVG